ncbi:MAG: hypothetical protein GC138_09050 [Gammaproteobacteria bacterium]|nr:hypothetical protein [Gammaproteobacteria bacterium]
MANQGTIQNLTFTPTGGSGNSAVNVTTSSTGATVSLNWSGINSFTVTENGGDGIYTDVVYDNLVFAAANTAPTLGGTFTTSGTVNDNATMSPFSGVTVSDADANNVSVAITYTAANGTLSGTGITGSAGSYTVTSAAPATATNNLQGVTFTPTANQVAPGSTVVTMFTLTPNDGTVNGSSNSTTQVTATSINDAPVITSNGGGATASTSMNENSTAVTTVTSSDADTGETYTYSISGGVDQAKFSINSSTGALVFASAPNYESPTDSGANNVYDVQVTVTDSGTGNLTDVQDIAVTVNNINENPVITSNGGGATASINAAENQTAVTTVTAVDFDTADTLTFSISGGADQALFSINSSTGVLVFASAPNYESPTDSGANGVYDVQVTVTDNGVGTLTDVQAIAVTVTNVNEAPVITSNGGGATASTSVNENSTAVTTVTAIDVDTADTLTYSISGGADAAKFSINSSTGALVFASAPNYESPTDSGGNNVYDVQVTVTDNGTGNLTDVQDIAVTIININDSPVITSNGGAATASVNAAENQTAVTTVTATDEDPADTLTYSITGGADQALFTINSSTGVLTFASAPNYESPTDSGSDGVYDVQVTVTDNGAGTLTDVQSIAVTVTNVNDAPVITNLNGDGVNFSIGANAVVLDALSDATLSDADNPVDLNGGNVTASIVTNGQSGEDLLQVGSVGNISTSGSNVNHSDGVTIGTFAGGTGGASLVVTLNANATLARVRDLLSAIQYLDTDGATVNTATRVVGISVDDGDGGSSTSATQGVAVVLVRAPAIDLDGDDSSGASNGGYNGAFTEGGGAVAAADTDSVITDDGTFKALTVTLTTRPDGSAESLSSSYGTGAQTVNGEAVTISAYNTGTGVLTITVDDGSATAATMQMLIESVRYDNSSNAPTTTDRSITFVGTDNADNQGAASTAVLSVAATNDPVSGSVTISGTTMQGQTLTADAGGMSDPDGLGVFSYQWKRDGSAISGATSSTYTLALADVGAAISATVSFTDGGGTLESVTSAATSAIAGDLDGDTIADSVDPDIDGDGMSNAYENANGLDAYNPADRDTDLDGDGVSNYDESVAGSNANADDYPPAVTAPADVSVNATGLFTEVSLGSATAVDAKDGTLSPSVSQVNGVTVSTTPTHFQPGPNTVTWTATDAAGNSATATQNVNVTPLVGFSKDQVNKEGDTVTFKAILNGKAVTYPVTVPYTVGGTASTDGSDHDLVDGSVTFASSNTEASITVHLVNDGPGEGTEYLVVTMGTPGNAVRGAVATHRIEIDEVNVAPLVSLMADQGSGATRIVDQTGGSVTVTAAVTDSTGDTHTYDWSTTDNALVDTDSADGTFTFDPSGLTPGLYSMGVAVSDGTDTTNAKLLLNVVASPPTLTTADTDGDGVDDVTDGFGDSDGDGVPNYLDNSNVSRNVIQEKSGNAGQFLMESEPGLSLSLGNVAFRANGDRTEVSTTDVTTYGNEGSGASQDRGYAYDGGLFDFNVDQLPVAGQQVRVVVAQFAAIPADAVYRKLTSTGWQDFVVNANNSVASAAGAEGYCPPPGDASYTSGLTQGDWCVQLTIEDGGPNDSDGVVNQQVSDPGGVAVQTAQPLTIVVRSGSGALSPWWLMLLALLVLRRAGNGRVRLLPALLLVLSGGGAASAEELSLKPTYVGVKYLWAKSDERSAEFQSELDALGLTATVTQSDLSRSGWSPYVGYQINELAAVELGYVDLGDATTTIDGLASDVNAYLATASAVHPTSASGWTLDGVLRKHLPNNVDLLARAGVLWWHADYTLSSATASRSFSDRGLNGNLGLGVETELNVRVPVRLGWTRYFFSGTNVDAFELGLGYRF